MQIIDIQIINIQINIQIINIQIIYRIYSNTEWRSGVSSLCRVYYYVLVSQSKFDRRKKETISVSKHGASS